MKERKQVNIVLFHLLSGMHHDKLLNQEKIDMKIDTKCKSCGKELRIADDPVGETLGFVCANLDCSEYGVIV